MEQRTAPLPYHKYTPVSLIGRGIIAVETGREDGCDGETRLQACTDVDLGGCADSGVLVTDGWS